MLDLLLPGLVDMFCGSSAEVVSRQFYFLFLATKRLLKRDHGVPFPWFKDKLTFANQEGSFFNLLRRSK